MRRIRNTLLVIGLGLLVSGCQTWSSAKVNLNTATPDAANSDASKSEMLSQTPIEKIVITDKDISDRPYKILGDIKVSVSKSAIYFPDPTREMVDERLREEAAKLKADAVILVRYGTVGISVFSWGKLDGRGRAIAFLQ